MPNCTEVDCTFATDRPDNLERHLRKEHSFDDDAIRAFRQKRKDEKAAARQVDGDLKEQCPHCPQRLLNKHSLRQHLRTKHPDMRADPSRAHTKNVRCPIDECGQTGLQSREDLAVHCRLEHSDEGVFDVIERSFSSMKEMDEWKHRVETLSMAIFTKESNQSSRHYYWCSRGNKNRADETDINRNSSRTQSHCSAFVNACLQGDGSVSVKACLDHIGHDLDPARLPLNATQRENLAHVLTQGFTVTKVKEKLREYGELHPLYWMSTERSVRKLIASRKERPWEKEANDHLSLEKRYQEEGAESGIRHLTTTPGDFAVVIVTPVQLEWIKKFGHRGLSIDDTFNTSKWPYKLTTVMLLDEKDRGLPAAFLLSSHTTQDEVHSLFKIIGDLVPSFDTQWFMSDDAPAFYNGFKRAFPKTKSEHLHCQWHTIKSLRQHASDIYGTKDERGKTVAATARNVARTIQRTEFWKSAMSLLSDLDTDREEDKVYKKYFEKYLHSFHLWAPFARRHAPFNTTMVSESFHSKLKISILGDNTLSRVDRLVDVLLSLPADLSEELRIADRKNYVSGVFRLQSQMASHKRGVSYGNTNPKVIRKDTKTWSVESEKKGGIEYTVTDSGEECCTCDTKNLHCMRCGVCPRRYLCNCPDGNRPGTSCKHAHWVIISSNQEDSDVPEAIQKLGIGDRMVREHDYFDSTPVEPIREEEIPLQFVDNGNEEEREERRRENEELDRRKEQKQKYRTLCLEMLNKATAAVGRCMREDEDEERLKEIYHGLIDTLGRVDVRADDAATRGERPKKRQGGRGDSLLERETRSDIRRRRREEMNRPTSFPLRQPAEISVCAHCRKAAPAIEDTEEDFVNWVACENENLCGLFFHESCCPIGSLCLACKDGRMIYKEID